jgi:hypothetical protein
MSAASSLLKPLAGFQLASLDAVAIAIAETNVELRLNEPLSRSSEIPAKRLAPLLTHPEPFMEAVSEIVLGVRVAGRRRDSEPLHRDARRPRDSEAVSIPQGKVVLRDMLNARFRFPRRLSLRRQTDIPIETERPSLLSPPTSTVLLW